MRRNSSFDSVLLRVNSERLLITGHSPFQFNLATDAYFSAPDRGNSATFANPAAHAGLDLPYPQEVGHDFALRRDELYQFFISHVVVARLAGFFLVGEQVQFA